MQRIRDYCTSLAARMTLLLAIGIAGASIASLLVAEKLRTKDFERLQLDRIVASSRDMSGRFSREPAETERLLERRALFGVRFPDGKAPLAPADPRLERLLHDELGEAAQATANRITSNCFGGMFDPNKRVAGLDAAPEVECWRVGFVDGTGTRRTVIVDLPAFRISRSSALDPVYLVLIVVASALVSALTARLTTVPLRRLTKAARSFSVSLDPEPISEAGPAEVRGALATFNLMQQRVRDGFRDRTQMLAAIAHDLQTPLTRLRLRLEQVSDPALRERLIADLATMQHLVRDGLELARSSESREPWSLVEIDSLVSSLVEDAIETGAAVSLTETCAVTARVKPDALTRCLNNLIENAVKYGGGATLSCRRRGDQIEIAVRDHGPGFPEGRIEEMLEPFVRGESSRSRETGGTGIGLTIAAAQARTFGAVMKLANHPDGGAIATLSFAIA